MRLVLFGVFLQMSLLFSVPVQALEFLILDESRGEHPLGRFVDILEDPQGELSIDEITSPEIASQFRSSNVDVPNFGFTKSVYWLRWRLKNTAQQPSKWLLDQGFANTHFMDLYQERADGQGFILKKSGNLRPYDGRDIPHRRIIFSIELPANADQTFYLKVLNGASMTLDLRLRSWANLASSDRKESFWMGLFYGALLIMLGYNLFSFFLLRDARYGWLVFFIIMSTGALLFYDGYAQQITGKSIIFISAWALPFFLASCAIGLLKFDQAAHLFFFDAKAEANILKYGYKTFLGLWIVHILMIPFVAYGSMLKSMIFLMFITVAAVVARNLLNWNKNRRSVSFFLTAWSVFLVALAALALTRMGWLDDSLTKFHATRISLLWLTFVMSLALADRINLMRREAERVNNSLLESETQRRLAMQASNTGAWSWDIASNLTHWSEETEAIHGINKGSFGGRYDNFRKFVHPEDFDLLEQKIQLALKINKPYSVEYRIIRPDGEQRWLAAFGEVFRDEMGHPVSMFGIVRDITDQKQTEQVLLQQEEKYRSLFKKASDGIMLLRDGHIIDCNPKVLEIYGCSLEELIGKTPVDLSPEFQADGSVSAEVADEMARRTIEGSKESFEWRHIRKDGTEFDVEISVSTIDFEGERLLQAIVRDITERKRTEEAIKNIAAGVSAQTGELFFKQLVLQLSKLFKADYAFIGLLDDNDPLLVNTYTLSVHGEIKDNISYSLRGTPCANVVGQSACSYPRDVQQLFPRDKLLVNMGVESYIGTPLFSTAGEAMGLIVILDSKPMGNINYIQEILSIFAARAGAEMERLKSEQKLAEAEQRLSLHIKQTPLGVIEWDTEFRVKAWNPAAEKIFGYPTQEVLGCHATELILTPEVIPLVDQIWQDLLAQKGGTRSTNQNVTKEGKTIICEWYNTPLATDKGEVMGVASLVADITDRVQAEAELAAHRDHLEEMVEARTSALSAVNKELESFSYSVSHDLRAPLRTINGFSLALIEDYGGQMDVAGKDYLNRLRSASVRMDGLIQDMLALSKINRQEIKPQVVSLSKLAKEILEEYRRADPQRQVNCKIQDDIECYCDRQLMRIALDNLLGNAWKYTSKLETATVEFGSTTSNAETTYYIRDNGAGFNMKYVNKIFDAFQRLHHERDFEGTGVGLATVVRVMNRHGGHIWAEAKPNEGATFYFTLPSRKQSQNDSGWFKKENHKTSFDANVH